MEKGMNKVVIVKKKTRLEELKERFNTVEQARFYIEHLGADFQDYLDEHNKYYEALEAIRLDSGRFARVQEIDRNYIANMIFGGKDIVVTLGQDGLVVNVMKYLNGQPLIGINPDPYRFEGDLLRFHPGELGVVLPAVIRGEYDALDITMAEAGTKDGQHLYAVNDFFVGVNDHTSARYEFSFDNVTENQSSSGVIISTPFGMTGWHKSIMAQFRAMSRVFRVGDYEERSVGWNEKELVFQVREPYPSVYTQADLVYGVVGEGQKLKLVSKMPEKGVVFSDGVTEDAIEFNSGMELTIQIADHVGRLVDYIAG